MIYVQLTIITDTTSDKFIFNVSASLICICQQFIMYNIQSSTAKHISTYFHFSFDIMCKLQAWASPKGNVNW